MIKIARPTQRKEQFLETYQDLFNAAVQLGLDFAHENQTASRTKIHRACYYEMRSLGLPSEYARMAVNKAVSMAAAFYGQRKSKRFKKVSWPKINGSLPLGLGIHAYRLFREDNRWILRMSLGKCGAYLWLPLCVPQRYLDTLSLAKGDAEIFCRNRKWYAKLPIRLSTSTPTISDGAQFVGVDLGIAKVATIVGPGFVEFFSGRAIQNRRRRFQTYRKRMGRKKRLDKIRASKDKESNWQRDQNHKISREIVNWTAGVPGGVLVLERLEGIRTRVRGSKRFNRMISNWAFRQLSSMIAYKAAKAGVPIVWVDPRKTSQRCSRCGHTSRANRPDQAHFRCVSCGYRANSDYNAAVNISKKGLYASSRAPSDMARASLEVPGIPAREGYLMPA